MDKTKKKANIRGIIMLLVWMTVGGIIGYIFASGIITMPTDFSMSPSIYYEYDVLFGIIALLSLVLTVMNTRGLIRTRRMQDVPEHEGEIDSPKEKSLSKVLQNCYYNTVITYLWLIMSFAHAMAPGGKESNDAPFMLANMITALLIMLFAFFIQRRAIVLYNNNYPDRQLDISIGNSKKAQRELFAKMDEGEQWIVYRSSYSAFKISSICLVLSMLAFAMYSLLFGFTPMPMIVLALILIIQQAVYYREVSKYG